MVEDVTVTTPRDVIGYLLALRPSEGDLRLAYHEVIVDLVERTHLADETRTEPSACDANNVAWSEDLKEETE